MRLSWPDVVQVAVGQVSSADALLVKRLGIPPPPAGKPSLATICNGDPATAEVAQGELKTPEITRLLAQFRDGKKCRQRAPLCIVSKMVQALEVIG